MKWGRRMQVFVRAATVLGVVAALVAGCGSKRATLNNEAQASAQAISGFTQIQEPPEYRIFPGDELDIKFFFNPELNETVFVRPDGKISLQLVDDIQTSGLTPSELDVVLTRNYAHELRKPAITVIVKSFTGQRVYVAGEVGKPGEVALAPGMTVLQAVFSAGGFLDTAKPDAALVIRNGTADAPIPIRVDLEQSIDGESTVGDIQLQPFDIVYIPKTWIAEANVFVDQHIRGLLMFRGWGIDIGRGIWPNN